ncbi:hypothetical protein ACFO3I_03270 [Rheinheimera marina]|uniref:Site-specific integrase n=1 Tax=Rheinheimera marina TaxID=1774958 RepID=A0ABV9JH44_9GAMM
MAITEFDQFFTRLSASDEQRIAYTNLLRTLHTPPTLKYIEAVLKNFRLTFSDGWLEDIGRSDEFVSLVHHSQAEANSLLSNLEQLSQYKQFKRHQTKTKLSQLFHGDLEKNPYYPLHYLLNRDNADFYRWLRQVLFILPFLVKDKVRDEERLKTYEPVTLGLFFRQLTEDVVAIAWLKQKNCGQCKNLRAFVGWLYEYRAYYRKYYRLSNSDLAKNGAKESKDPIQNAIAIYHQISTCIRILEIPLGHEKKRRASGRRSVKRFDRDSVISHGVTALENNILVQVETLPGEQDNLLFSILQGQLDDEHVDAGEEIFEQQQAEVYLFAEHEPLESYIAAFHGRRLSKSVMRRLERQHQYLYTDHHALTNSQIFQLLNWCQYPPQTEDAAEAALVAITSFFTGYVSDRLIQTTVNLSTPQFPKLDLARSVMALPQYQVPYAESMSEVATNKIEGLQLPMPALLADAFTQYTDGSHYLWAEHGQPLRHSQFSHSTDTLKNYIYDTTGLVISVQQIANTLFLRACAMFGSACATLMFNRPAPGSQARLYYTSLPAQLLQTRYQKLVETVLHDAGFGAEKAFHKAVLPQLIELGCRQAPSLDDYNNLLNGLSKKLQGLRKNRLSSDWVQFHNHYTAYCIVAQGLLTGLRPTHQGFIPLRDILLAAQVAVVRDKDSDDEYHTRTIPLHPLAIRIAEAYHTHVQAMLGRLHRIGLLKQWQAAQGPEPFFFTNAGAIANGSIVKTYPLSIMAFKPSLLRKEVAAYFSGPPNGNRKLLRSWFEKKSVPTFCIDALLGHGNLGETIWHQHNTLSFEDVRLTLMPHLDDLVKLLEIKALKGLHT